ncbi:MAG: glycosyl hydrolase [Cellvibrio sp.]
MLRISILILATLISSCSTTEKVAFAPKPLFRDPIFDGAADAALIKNSSTGQWEMFYTNRRATLRLDDKKDVSWVHGTAIGIATTKDGNNWSYKELANFPKECMGETLWAPEIFAEQGTYHMWLTIVPGIYSAWVGKPFIQHLTSKDLRHWQCGEKLDLGSDNVIDASVIKLPDNTGYRLWFKDQNKGSRIFYADSKDLIHWSRKDKVIDRNAEGPKIFFFGGKYWLVADIWKGLMVLSSDDSERWVEQTERLLPDAGLLATDKAKGQHPDIQVVGDKAFIFYFVHQENEAAASNNDRYGQRTVIQVAELKIENGKLTVDRNAKVNLAPYFRKGKP